MFQKETENIIPGVLLPAIDQEEKIMRILETINDPEIPVLSIIDLGIVRKIEIHPEDLPALSALITISITPTYSGCPALDAITLNIRLAMLQNGFKNFEVKTVLSPAWTTEWMSLTGRQKLEAYGIAPPNASVGGCLSKPFQDDESVKCPLCNSIDTRLISQFASTACKALYKCNNCHEPFDYFKCH